MVTTTTTTCQMATVTRRLWMHHQRPLRRLWDSLQREQRPHALRCPSMLPRSEIRCLSETADGEGIYVITTPLFYVNAGKRDADVVLREGMAVLQRHIWAVRIPPSPQTSWRVFRCPSEWMGSMHG